MSIATSPAPKPAQLPQIRYRVETDDGREWAVMWRMGMKWLKVYGPATERAAREHLELLLLMPL